MATIEEFKSPSLIERITRQSRELFRILDDLWRAVEPSVSNAKIVFPEYTPHDFTHLQRLFGLCESILTKEQLARLNTTECFLLSAAIISHDWGMGVSLHEQQAIIAGKEGRIKFVGPDDDELSIALLPDELRRLHQHQLAKGIEFKWNDNSGTLADPQQLDSWRDYLRNTHPERSAERIRIHLYREKAIGQAIALISHGHGQEHSAIENTQKYSTHRLINGEFVNIQALTLYLRLIDLIDIGKGRTPYELWQYVNPGNQVSAKEWKKHRAMEEPRLEGGTIKFAALTGNGSILAELYNLKHYCEAEFEWQKRILRHPDSQKYQYVFQSMEWDITTEGNLHNTPVRFEFAREQLLHLLSEEIYDGDPYVFLRELIQNALDAIKTRQNCRLNTETPLASQFATVEVQATENNTVVTVRDAGSGMTSYVIEHYLAVAGRSYYRSQDFAKLGLNFDPISRFGIGILSSFVVAERVIIRTRTDPECFANGPSNASEAWRIEIPAGRNGLPLGYWEWTSIEPSSMNVGTEVTVIIDQQKLGVQIANLSAVGQSKHLQITDYLKVVARFSEFPIYVNEHFGKTVIIYPSFDLSTIEPLSHEYQISQLNYPYDLSEHVNPLSLSTATDHIIIETVDLTSLNIRGIEGVLSYPKPKHPWRVVARQAREITLCDRDGNEVKINGPRHTSGDEGFMENFRTSGICKSAKKFKRCGVYFQGLLMSDVSAPKAVGIHGQHTSTLLAFPNLFLNYTKQTDVELRPGPSRRSLRDSSENWASQIFAAHSKEVATRSREQLLSLDPKTRLGEIFRHLEQDFVLLEEFAHGFEWDEWPVPLLLKGGDIDVCLLKDLKHDTILIEAPHVIARIASVKLLNELGYKRRRTPSLKYWKFDRSIFALHFNDVPQFVTSYLSKVLQAYFHSSHGGRMAFTPPSLKGGQHLPPMYTNYWERRDARPVSSRRFLYEAVLRICEKGSHNARNLTDDELSKLRSIVPSQLHFQNDPLNLPNGFSRYCILSETLVSTQHLVGETLCRIFCAYVKAHLQNTLIAVDKARLEQLMWGLPIQAFSQVTMMHGRGEVPINSLQRLNNHLEQLRICVQDIEAMHLSYLPEMSITSLDFLPGAFSFVDEGNFVCFSFDGDSFLPEAFYDAFDEHDFGMLLEKNSSWP